MMRPIVYKVLAVAMAAALIKYGVITIFEGDESVVLEQTETLTEKVEVCPQETILQIQNNVVYVTMYGEKYHCESCSYLYRSKKAISLKQAKERCYTPCVVCFP